jgi:hypothetical protein
MGPTLCLVTKVTNHPMTLSNFLDDRRPESLNSIKGETCLARREISLSRMVLLHRVGWSIYLALGTINRPLQMNSMILLTSSHQHFQLSGRAVTCNIHKVVARIGYTIMNYWARNQIREKRGAEKVFFFPVIQYLRIEYFCIKELMLHVWSLSSRRLPILMSGFTKWKPYHVVPSKQHGVSSTASIILHTCSIDTDVT